MPYAAFTAITEMLTPDSENTVDMTDPKTGLLGMMPLYISADAAIKAWPDSRIVSIQSTRLETVKGSD